MGIDDSSWFARHPPCAVRDFFDVCEHRPESLEVPVRALASTAGGLVGGVDHYVAEARDHLRWARAGDWPAIERRLRSLGAASARSAIPLAAWHAIVGRFHDQVVASAVETYAGEPARLSAVLLVLGDCIERVLAIIDESARDQRERERAAATQALERSAARLEIVSRTGDEFAAAPGRIDDLLALVACRLGQIFGEACSVRLISQDGAWIEPTASFYHPDPEIQDLVRPILARAREPIGDGMDGRVAATGIAERIAELDTERMLTLDAPGPCPVLARMGVASALAVALRSRGRTVGVISLWRSAPGEPHTIDDQRLAQDLADRAGLAIDNAVLVATLEHRVSERTAALEAANHELEAFGYSVSHDLRSPLRAIDGFSRILMSDYEAVLDHRGQHYLQRIRSGSQRMATLIDNLLNLARITRVSLALGVHDLSALAAEIVSELARRDPERAVQVHIAPGITARVDASLARVALENLLGNAWKFTARHDPAQIWFGADGETFHVRDTGAGFDMTYAEKLFLPFHRLHAAREYDGTGVGLATVHRIIVRHGGRIWAEAAVGGGATFYFTLGTPSPLGDDHGRTA